MGSFATNGINMIKLESYQIAGAFAATQFYVEVEGHKDNQTLINAFEEMTFFTKKFRCLGSYPQSNYRAGRKT
jgi:prephenate dehydratase